MNTIQQIIDELNKYKSAHDLSAKQANENFNMLQDVVMAMINSMKPEERLRFEQEYQKLTSLND